MEEVIEKTAVVYHKAKNKNNTIIQKNKNKYTIFKIELTLALFNVDLLEYIAARSDELLLPWAWDVGCPETPILLVFP